PEEQREPSDDDEDPAGQLSNHVLVAPSRKLVAGV
ncbi:MAG: hypothetical protein RJA49_2659, partial [Actinomycetota bacterium]